MFSHSSGSQKSEVKVLAWRLLPGTVRESLLQACLPASGGMLASFGLPWIAAAAPRPCLHFRPVCLSAPKLPLFHKGIISHSGLEPTLITSLTGLSMKRFHLQKRSHSEVLRVKTLTYFCEEGWVDTIQSMTPSREKHGKVRRRGTWVGSVG